MADLDHAEHVFAAGSRHRLARVVLERPDDGADRDLHLRSRLDVLEDQQPVLLEQILELRAQLGVLQALIRDASDAGAEGEIVADGMHA